MTGINIQGEEICIFDDLIPLYQACKANLEKDPTEAYPYLELGNFYERVYLDYVGFDVDWDLYKLLLEALGTYYVAMRFSVSAEVSEQILQKVYTYRVSPTPQHYRAAKDLMIEHGLQPQQHELFQSTGSSAHPLFSAYRSLASIMNETIYRRQGYTRLNQGGSRE